MTNKLIPWQRYLSDIAHKYVGYPDEEGGEDNMFVVTLTQDEQTQNYISDKSSEEIFNAVQNGEIPIAIYKTDDEVFTYTFNYGETLVENSSTIYWAYFINIAADSNSVSFDELRILGTSCYQDHITITATQEG